MKEFLKKEIIIPGTLLFFLLLGCNGLNSMETEVAAQVNATPIPEEILIACRLSEQNLPNNSIANMVDDMGQSQHTRVTVDQNNDGTIDYDGAAGSGPSLQYNEGPKALDGSMIWDKPIQDNICVYGQK